jgi:predicted nuclease with TOPRIM domain
MVNGVDINQGQYPVLNFKPATAQYPYIYVPIAEFSRVGAQVVWDEIQQLLTVTTDYYDIKSLLSSLTSENTNLNFSINTLKAENQALQTDCEKTREMNSSLTSEIIKLNNTVNTLKAENQVLQELVNQDTVRPLGTVWAWGDNEYEPSITSLLNVYGGV